MTYTPFYQALREYLEIPTEDEVYQIPVLFDKEFVELEKQLNHELSLEDNFINGKKIKDFFLRILKWIKDNLIKLYQYLKTKLGSWIKSKGFKNNIKKIKFIAKTNYLSQYEWNEITNIVISQFSQEDDNKQKVLSILNNNNYHPLINDLGKEFEKEHISSLRTISYLIDEKGKVRDVNALMNSVMDFIQFLKNNDHDTIMSKYNQDAFGNTLDNSNNLSYTQLFPRMITDYLGYPVYKLYPSDFKIDILDLCDKVETIDELFEQVNYRFNALKKSLEKEIDETLSEMRQAYQNNIHLTQSDSYKALLQRVDKLRLMSLCADVPVVFLMNLTRFISRLTSVAFDQKYISTTIPLSDKLYHLSDNPKLPSILKPNKPLKGGGQYLPPRISFSPDPESAFFGLSNVREYFKQNHDNDLGKIETKILYLYEGIPEKGKTRYLKEELVKGSIAEEELRMSEEICVVSQIKVKFVGRVEIIYRPNLNVYDWNRLVSIKVLD